jgi:hypothetical protein
MPFEATYQVTVDGKPRIVTIISLDQVDGQWRHESRSKGTRGMAKFLKADSRELSTGTFESGRFTPHHFEHTSRLAGKDEHWSAQFNWDTMRVTTRHEGGTSVLPLSTAVTDPLSMTLAIRRLLKHGMLEMKLEIVDEDEIRLQEYHTRPAEAVETLLGCIMALPLERVREADSKRYSTGWYAPGLAWMPVRIQHGKKGGKEFDMRLTRLVLDGEPVTMPGDCSG